MDFLPAVPRDVPKQLYKAELTLSIGGGSRRGSTSSDGGQSTGRRRSFAALGLGGGGGGNQAQDNGKQPETHAEGVWYWPCQVGATEVSCHRRRDLSPWEAGRDGRGCEMSLPRRNEASLSF